MIGGAFALMMTARKEKRMEQDIIILSADYYNMKLEDGSHREGTSIFYVGGIEPVVNETGRSYGYKPVKESMPAEFINEIAQAGGCPIKARATFVIRMAGGKQVLKIASCNFQKAGK